MAARAAAAALMISACPGVARAQLSAPREQAQIAYGPLSVYPRFQILDAGSDSNVFNDGQNPKDDYTATLVSRALVVARLGSNELLASAGSDYQWFQQYASERSSNGSYAMRLNLSTSRLKPFVGGERTRTRTRPNAEIDARARRLVDRVLAGASVGMTERTALTVSGEASRTSYDEGQRFLGADLATALNSTTRAAAAGLRYSITPLTTIRFEGAYREDIFPESHLRDATTYSFSPTVEFDPDAVIHGSFSAGVARFVPKDTRFDRYTGPTFEGGLSWILFGRTGVDVHAARGVSYSYQDENPYYLSTRLAVSVTERLFGPVSLQGGAGRQYLSYRWQSGSLAAPTPSDRTISESFSGGVLLQLPHALSVGLSAEHARRRSELDSGLDYAGTRLLTSLTIGY